MCEWNQVRKQVKTVVLGQMVIDTVVHDNKNLLQIKSQENKKGNLIVGGPPSFAGIAGLTLSKVFPWISTPLIYAYACPEVISLLENHPDIGLISRNLKIRTQCPHFFLIYSSDKIKRNLMLRNPPSQFDPTHFNWKITYPPVAIVGSIFHEFNNFNSFNFLRKKCSFIAFDSQGCFRQLTPEGNIIFRNWWDPKIIDNLDCLKISGEEAEFLNLGKRPEKIVARILKTPVTSVLLTQGINGSILGIKELKTGDIHIYNVPAFTEGAVLDETGAGDIFLFTFVSYFNAFNNELDAIAFATSVTSLLLEQKRFMWHLTKKTVKMRQKQIKNQIIEF